MDAKNIIWPSQKMPVVPSVIRFQDVAIVLSGNASFVLADGANLIEKIEREPSPKTGILVGLSGIVGLIERLLKVSCGIQRRGKIKRLDFDIFGKSC